MTTAGVGMVKQVGLSGMGKPVSTGLLQKVWESGVDVETVQYDPMLTNIAQLTDTVEATGNPVSMPMNNIVVRVKNKNTAARSVIQPFLQALAGTGKYGTDTLLGYEELRQLKYLQIYANDWKHAVALDAYGINFREMSPYQISQMTKQDLARWRGELFGKFIRQAFCEGVDASVAYTPVSRSQPTHPNVYFPSLASSSQATPHGTSMDSQIGTAAKAVTATSCHLTVPRINSIAKYFRISRYVKPMQIAGITGYVLFTHPDEIEYLKDTSVDQSFASQVIKAHAVADAKTLLPTLQFVIGDVFICEDPRCPSMIVSGNSTSGYTNSYGYMGMGRVDGRDTGVVANTDFNANILCGDNAIVQYEPEPLHYENQLDEYAQYDNLAIVGANGFNRADYNVDTTSDSYSDSLRGTIPTIENVSSGIVFTQRM